MGKENNDVARQQLWVVVAVSSAVALASLVTQIHADNPTRTPSMKFIVSAATITMAVAVIYALAHSFKIDLMLGGIETCFAITNLILWILAIRLLFHQTDLATASTAPLIVTNANLYYFSWAGVIFSAIVVGKTFEGKQTWFDNITRRFNKWGFLVITSLVAMTSSIEWWKSSSCKTATTTTTTCKNLELSLAFGAIVAGLSFLTMIAAFFMKERKNIMVIWEILVSIVGVVLYASATRRLTSPNAPASTIGNLYYFTWFSLFASIMLFFDSLMEKFHPASSSDTETPEVEEMEAKTTPAPEAAMPEMQATPVGETQV